MTDHLDIADFPIPFSPRMSDAAFYLTDAAFTSMMDDPQSLADPQSDQFLEAIYRDIAFSPAVSETAPTPLTTTTTTTSTSTSCSPLPRVLCNNKMALDAKWAHLNHLTTVQLNRFIRLHKLSDEDVLAIKQARRRAKGREYSETARQNKKKAITTATTTTTTTMSAMAASPAPSTTSLSSNESNSDSNDVRKELRLLQQELQQARNQVARLTAQLLAKGISQD